MAEMGVNQSEHLESMQTLSRTKKLGNCSFLRGLPRYRIMSTFTLQKIIMCINFSMWLKTEHVLADDVLNKNKFGLLKS